MSREARRRTACGEDLPNEPTSYTEYTLSSQIGTLRCFKRADAASTSSTRRHDMPHE